MLQKHVADLDVHVSIDYWSEQYTEDVQIFSDGFGRGPHLLIVLQPPSSITLSSLAAEWPSLLLTPKLPRTMNDLPAPLYEWPPYDYVRRSHMLLISWARHSNKSSAANCSSASGFGIIPVAMVTILGLLVNLTMNGMVLDDSVASVVWLEIVLLPAI